MISGDTWQTASDGAASHRRFYRGHDLTAAFESGEFSRNVADGSFRDIFPGDYIIKKVAIPDIQTPDYCTRAATYTIKFIIADLDFAMNQGFPSVTAHHAVIVPETPVFCAKMNHTDTKEGGYAGSDMYKTVMPAFAIGLICAFGAEHLLKCSFDGSDSAASSICRLMTNPHSCICRLMTLSMVFGQTLPGNGYGWSDFIKDSCLGGEQLAAFSHHPELRDYDWYYWVSDLVADWRGDFAAIGEFGGNAGVHLHAARACYDSWLHSPGGVRPFALLV